MPARSNLLQRVLFHVERQLAEGASVTESGMLPERVSSHSREVDIVIQTQVGDHRLFVCVECQDRSRRATVEWVEQMAMKHSALPTSKLILVAAKGFASTAVEKARSLGIDTYSLDEAVLADWKQLFGNLSSTTTVVMRILNVLLTLSGVDGKLVVPKEFGVFNADGTLHCSLGELVHDATVKSNKFCEHAAMQYVANIPTMIGAELKPQFIVFAQDFKGTLHQIECITLFVEMRPTTALSGFKAMRYRDNSVAFEQGRSPIGDFVVTLTKPATGDVKGTATISNAKTGETDTQDVRFVSEDGKLAFVSNLFYSKPS